MEYDGIGKYYDDDGNIYIGNYKNDKKTEGNLYELQEDGTHTLFQVKYDEFENKIDRKQISKGHNMV